MNSTGLPVKRQISIKKPKIASANKKVRVDEERNEFVYHSKEENPLPNFKQAMYSTKPHGMIHGFSANTHQGLSRNYNEDRVSIIMNIS